MIKWANEVRVRVQGAVSDLYAAEARYHRDCINRFFQDRSLPGHNKKIDYQHQEQATGMTWL